MDIRGHLAFHVFLYGQSLARSRSNFGSGSSLGIGQKDGISAQCHLWSLSMAGKDDERDEIRKVVHPSPFRERCSLIHSNNPIEFVLLIQDLLAPMLGRLP